MSTTKVRKGRIAVSSCYEAWYSREVTVHAPFGPLAGGYWAAIYACLAVVLAGFISLIDIQS